MDTALLNVTTTPIAPFCQAAEAAMAVLAGSDGQSVAACDGYIHNARFRYPLSQARSPKLLGCAASTCTHCFCRESLTAGLGGGYGAGCAEASIAGFCDGFAAQYNDHQWLRAYTLIAVSAVNVLVVLFGRRVSLLERPLTVAAREAGFIAREGLTLAFNLFWTVAAALAGRLQDFQDEWWRQAGRPSGCCSIAVRLLLDCCWIVVRLLFDCYPIAIRLLFDCCSTVVRLFFECCSIVCSARCAARGDPAGPGFPWRHCS